MRAARRTINSHQSRIRMSIPTWLQGVVDNAVLIIVPGHELIYARPGRRVLWHRSQEGSGYIDKPWRLIIHVGQLYLHWLLVLDCKVKIRQIVSPKPHWDRNVYTTIYLPILRGTIGKYDQTTPVYIDHFRFLNTIWYHIYYLLFWTKYNHLLWKNKLSRVSLSTQKLGNTDNI